jgi:MOSC domain-containing protein YiiM
LKIVSVNVGKKRKVQHGTQEIETGIFKFPVSSPVLCKRLGIESDDIVDLKFHGTPYMAVYGYSTQDYKLWEKELGKNLEIGIFGENLTIDGLEGEALNFGDRLQFGEVILEVSQPRYPCFKLGIRFGDPTIVVKYTKAKRWGIYFKVFKEGKLEAGMTGKIIHRDTQQIPVYSAFEFREKNPDLVKIQKMLALPDLDPRLISKLKNALA